MRRARGLLLLGWCAPLLAGTNVVPYGKDTFMTTAVSMVSGKAERAAVLDASQHCQKLGKVFSPVSQTATPGGGRRTNVTLIFRCYAEDDPRNTPPDMQPAPDVIIENRR